MPLKGLVVRAQKTDGCPVHSGHRVDPVGCVGGGAHEVAAIRSGSNIWITASVWRWPPQVPLSRRQLPLSWSDKRVPSPLFPSLLLPPPPHSRLLRAQVLFFMFLVIFLSILDCLAVYFPLWEPFDFSEPNAWRCCEQCLHWNGSALSPLATVARLASAACHTHTHRETLWKPG